LQRTSIKGKLWPEAEGGLSREDWMKPRAGDGNTKGVVIKMKSERARERNGVETEKVDNGISRARVEDKMAGTLSLLPRARSARRVARLHSEGW